MPPEENSTYTLIPSALPGTQAEQLIHLKVSTVPKNKILLGITNSEEKKLFCKCVLDKACC